MLIILDLSNCSFENLCLFLVGTFGQGYGAHGSEARKYALTSLPLVSVRRHGHVNSVKVEIEFLGKLRFLCARHILRCKCIELPYQYVSRLNIQFLGKVLTFNKREDKLCPWILHVVQ